MAASQRTKEIAAAEQTVADMSTVGPATAAKFARYVQGFAPSWFLLPKRSMSMQTFDSVARCFFLLRSFAFVTHCFFSHQKLRMTLLLHLLFHFSSGKPFDVSLLTPRLQDEPAVSSLDKFVSSLEVKGTNATASSSIPKRKRLLPVAAVEEGADNNASSLTLSDVLHCQFCLLHLFILFRAFVFSYLFFTSPGCAM